MWKLAAGSSTSPLHAGSASRHPDWMAAGIADMRCGFFQGLIVKGKNKRGSAPARSLPYRLARLYCREELAFWQYGARAESHFRAFVVRFVDEC